MTSQHDRGAVGWGPNEYAGFLRRRADSAAAADRDDLAAAYRDALAAHHTARVFAPGPSTAARR